MKTNIVMVLSGLLILALINISIWQKQTHLSKGEVIYLELAPIDPRSLMQGDYMALRFKIEAQIYTALAGIQDSSIEDSTTMFNFDQLAAEDGYVVVEKDENSVAQFVNLENKEGLTTTQRKLQFRVRNDRIKFATNAFFFEQGDEPLFRNARYGVFRLNKKGEVLLTGMLDEQYNLLGANNLDEEMAESL